jgi:hypothetical protein
LTLEKLAVEVESHARNNKRKIRLGTPSAAIQLKVFLR